MAVDIDATNFFVAGGTLRYDSPSYVKRPADDELFNLTLAGQFCYVLTARQMGKSSLMIQTARRLKAEGASSVIIDLTKIGTDVSVEQWYLGLITQLKRRLRLPVNPAAWWEDHATLGHVQRFTDFLRDVVLNEIREQVVIFMDEIDTTLNLDFSDDFFAAIRFIYNARASDPTYERLTFVLLGVATPADLIKDRARTPFNIGQGIDLTDFGQDDTHVLKGGLETAHPDDGAAIFKRIFYWTHGHPYLTQKLCLSVAETPNGQWTNEQVDHLVENLFLSKEARKETNLQFVRDSITASPDQRRLLKLYSRVYKDKSVADDERSLIQNQLKLFGLVRVEDNQLKVRNEIYRRVFNNNWIKETAPVDWTRRAAIMLTMIVIILVGMLGISMVQPFTPSITDQAQANTSLFRETADPVRRLTSLAGLFDLPGYKEQAQNMFYNELTAEEQVGLFTGSAKAETATESIIVVKGLYITLENNEADNALLKAMANHLQQTDDAKAISLSIEIEQWLEGRSLHNQGKYNDAVIVYGLVLKRNNRNPGLYFDRALAYLALDEKNQALADFEMVINLDEKRQNRVLQTVTGDYDLYQTLHNERETHQVLAALIPAATNTPTPTASPTHTATPTLTNTPLPTPTPSPTNTPTTLATSAATDAPTPAPSPIQTEVVPPATPTQPPPPTPTITPTPTATPIPTPKPATVVYVQGKSQVHALGLVSSSGEDLNLQLHEFAAAPAWSPDGRQVAFFGETGISQLGGIYSEGNGLWLINLSDRATQQLHKIDHIKNISWSPDGLKLAFETQPPNVAPQIYVVDARNGYELSRFPGQQPAWGPDSQTLAIKTCAPECGLWRTNADGSGHRLLTSDGSDSFPVWSPDGASLVFTSRSRTGDWELWRFDLAEKTYHQLTDRAGTDITPVFSPDGLELYYRTDAFGVWQIRALNLLTAEDRLIRDAVGMSDDWGLARPGVH